MFAEETGYEYLSVLGKDIRGSMWLEAPTSCTADATARALMKWCALKGAPRVWVSDTVVHLRNELLMMLVEALGSEQHFSVTHCVWTNGTAELQVEKVVETGNVVLSEAGWTLNGFE